jgi:phosphoribosylamine--glycine ligase
MKILVISEAGDGLGLAWRMSQEGHNVTVALKYPNFKRSGQGLYNRVQAWRPLMDESEFILCDSLGYGAHERLLHRRGRVVYGANQFEDWIVDLKQEDFLKECGFAKPEKFDDFLLLVGWFNGRNWLDPYFLAFKEVYLLPGNLGPVVGCMGCTVVPIHDCVLVQETMAKMTVPLRKISLKGMVTCAFTADESVNVVRVAPGLNYDVVEAIGEGLKGELADLLFSVASGLDSVDVSDDYTIAVRLTLPPWPYTLPTDVGPGPIVEGLTAENLNHIYLSDVSKEDGSFRAAMGSGVVLKATARGRSIREAKRRVYRTLSNINLPGKQYRLDIGDGVDDKLRDLRDRGFIDITI